MKRTLLLAALPLFACACGGVAISIPDSGATRDDAGPADAGTVAPFADASTTPGARRDGAAPSDAAPEACSALSCDPSPIVLSRGSGPAMIGTYCDELVMTKHGAYITSAVPTGWTCNGGEDLLPTSCTWPLSDAGHGGHLDSAALNAACTAARDLCVEIDCVVLD